MDNAFSLFVHREHASISMTHTQLATEKNCNKQRCSNAERRIDIHKLK